MDGRTG